MRQHTIASVEASDRQAAGRPGRPAIKAAGEWEGERRSGAKREGVFARGRRGGVWPSGGSSGSKKLDKGSGMSQAAQDGQGREAGKAVTGGREGQRVAAVVNRAAMQVEEGPENCR